MSTPALAIATPSAPPPVSVRRLREVRSRLEEALLSGQVDPLSTLRDVAALDGGCVADAQLAIRGVRAVLAYWGGGPDVAARR